MILITNSVFSHTKHLQNKLRNIMEKYCAKSLSRVTARLCWRFCADNVFVHTGAYVNIVETKQMIPHKLLILLLNNSNNRRESVHLHWWMLGNKPFHSILWVGTFIRLLDYFVFVFIYQVKHACRRVSFCYSGFLISRWTKLVRPCMY